MSRCKLGDLIDVTRGTSLQGKNYSEEGELIRLTLGNFDSKGGFKENTAKKDIYYIGNVKKEFILQKGDMITPLTEQTFGLLGSMARIPESNKYIQSQDIGLIKCKKEKIEDSFCYYLISSNLVRKQLSAAAQQTKIRHTSPDKIKDVIVDIPELDYQKKAGKILDYITYKIENNNKINEELEAMAKTIYDYCFLQFEFPNEEGKPYKSSGGKMVWNEELKRKIPEGWKCVKLDEIFNFVKGKIPSEIFCECNETHSTPYLTIEAINNSCEYCSEENMILTDGEVLMVMDGAASSEVYVGNKGAIGSTFCKLELKDKLVSNELLYLIMKKYESIFKKVNTGSTVPHANKNYINNFKIGLPKDNIQLEKIQKHIIMNIKQINMRKRENKELASLRDFLLPLLISGQVEFRELALAED